MDNHQLLREYVERQSEAAFAELVNRHVDLVYSTALRVVRDPTLAQDVSQLVFIQLARKAGSIRTGNALSGWLYQAAHGHAVNALSSERARRNREVEVMNMAGSENELSQAWNEIAAGLDDAMQSLNDVEQNAVVLRFFQGQSWRDVGDALEASEDTAQRRVNSALEKLRAHFLRRGITVTASVLAMTIGANAVQAAPATLGTHLAAGSLVAAGAKGSGVFSTILKSLVAKWQVTAAVVTGVAVVGVTTTALIRHDSEVVNAETVRRGLVLHLGFDQHETNGWVSDDSGRGNDGRVTGAMWTAEGRSGGAYEFRTDGDQIEVPNSPTLNPTNITISAWVKAPAPEAAWRYIIDKSAAPGYNLALIGNNHPNGRPGLAHSQMTDSGCVTGETLVADGNWHLLTSTYDGRWHCLYVDGRLEKENRCQQQNISNNLALVIGRHGYRPGEGMIGESFRGLVDDIRIYDRALSRKEVSFLFASAGQ